MASMTGQEPSTEPIGVTPATAASSSGVNTPEPPALRPRVEAEVTNEADPTPAGDIASGAGVGSSAGTDASVVADNADTTYTGGVKLEVKEELTEVNDPGLGSLHVSVSKEDTLEVQQEMERIRQLEKQYDDYTWQKPGSSMPSVEEVSTGVEFVKHVRKVRPDPVQERQDANVKVEEPAHSPSSSSAAYGITIMSDVDDRDLPVF